MSVPMDRPEHPDFWLLSRILTEMDAMAETSQGVPEIIGRHLDPESAVYAAFQRALRIRDEGISRRQIGELAGVWIDGLLVGMMLSQVKTREGSST